jgi:serine/threonine protein kinase, bacterial
MNDEYSTSTMNKNLKKVVLLAFISSNLLNSCSKTSATGSTTPPNQPVIPKDSLTIQTVVPGHGPDSTSVTITGMGFNNDPSQNQVFFNGKQAVLKSASSTQLVAVLPTLAGTGKVIVTVNGKNATGPIFTYDTTYMIIMLATGLRAPSFIVMDANGILYFSCAGSSNIAELTPAGIITTFGYLTDPLGLCLDGTGNLFFTSDTSNSYTAIYKRDPSGNISLFAMDYGQIGGMKMDHNGNIIAVNTLTNSIDKFTPDGMFSVLFNGQNNMSDLAIDNDNNIYYTATPNTYDETAGKVYRVTPGGTQTVFCSGLNFAIFNGIALDQNNNLYVNCFNQSLQTHNSVVKIRPDGTTTTLATNFMNWPGGIMADKDGNIFVVSQQTPPSVSGPPTVFGGFVAKLTPH